MLLAALNNAMWKKKWRKENLSEEENIFSIFFFFPLDKKFRDEE